MTALYRPDGTLLDLVAFDYETYLITETVASPRAVCGSFASNVPFPPFMDALLAHGGPSRGHYEERSYGDATMHLALLDADLAAEATLHFLALAASRSLTDDPLVLVAQNGGYDLGVTVSRVRLLEKTGRGIVVPVDPGLLHPHPAVAAWTLETLANSLIFDCLDVAATGLPDSPSVLADTKIRELLIKNAAGEMLHGTDLGSMVKKYLNEDRSSEKKGPPCTKCAATGKVTVPDPKKKSGVRQDACPVCNGAKYLTPWRMKYHTLDGVPLDTWPEDARSYAIEDALDTLAVVLAQGGPVHVVDYAMDSDAVVVDGLGAVTDEAHQTRALWALELCRMNGPRSNPDTIGVYREEMETMAAEGQQIGLALGFIRPDGTRDTKAHAALVEAAYERLGKAAPRTAPSGRFPDGQTKTDEDTIRLSRDEDLIRYVETNEGRLALSKFLPAAERGVEGALASSPGVFVATGRTSWSNPAMHQPPRKGMFRECWQARPGHVFVSCDWSAAEMVTLAQILVIMFGQSNMADAINAGQDLHTRLAVVLWNSQHPEDPVDYEELDRRIKDGDSDAKAMRQFAKIANFGFPGGLSAHTFVDYARGYGVIISENMAESIRDAWMAAWPEMHEYLEAFKAAASGGYFTYVQWVTGRIRGQVGYTNGCNTGFQGLVADALKIALWWSAREMYVPVAAGERRAALDYPHSPCGPNTPRVTRSTVPETPPTLATPSPLYGSRCWLSIHDEILLESPEGTASGAAKRLGDLMVWALRYCTPDVATAAEPALMREWRKDAEPVWEGDTLVPWEVSS
jgi:hypothetical protein